MKFIIGMAFILSSIIATLVLVAAIDHNTMEVFCKLDSVSECDFDFSYAAFVWALWFFPVFFASSALFLVVRSVYNLVKR